MRGRSRSQRRQPRQADALGHCVSTAVLLLEELSHGQIQHIFIDGVRGIGPHGTQVVTLLGLVDGGLKPLMVLITDGSCSTNYDHLLNYASNNNKLPSHEQTGPHPHSSSSTSFLHDLGSKKNESVTAAEPIG